MKKILKYILPVIFSLVAFAGVTYYCIKGNFYTAELLEKVCYAVWAVAVATVFPALSKKRAFFGKLVLSAFLSLIFSAAVFFANNFFKWLQINLEYFEEFTVPYFTVLKSDFFYNDGNRGYRYIIAFAIMFFILMIFALICNVKFKAFVKDKIAKIGNYLYLKDIKLRGIEEVYLDARDFCDYEDLKFYLENMETTNDEKAKIEELIKKYDDDKELVYAMLWKFGELMTRKEYIMYKNLYIELAQKEIERKREYYNSLHVDIPSVCTRLDEKFGVEKD